MRSLSKTFAGGVLALMLVVSASPAQAFAPQDPAPETEQTVPVTEPTDGTESIDEGTEETAPVEETTETTETPEAPDVGEEPEAVEPAAETQEDVVESDAPTTDESEAASDPITEVTAEIAVTGTVVIVPAEGEELTLEELEAGVQPAMFDGQVLVATDALGLLPVDPEAASGEFVEGADFTGTVTLPESAVEALEARIADVGEITQVEFAQIAHESLEPSVGLAAAGSASAVLEDVAVDNGIEAPVAGAVAAKAHSIDIVNFGGNAISPFPNPTSLANIATTVETYWKTQSGGAIKSMKIRSNKSLTTKKNRCSFVDMWNEGIWSLGYHNANTYLKSGRHLLAFVNQNCSSNPTVGNALGMGTIGTIHSGGANWVNLGTRSSGQHVNQLTRTSAHEIGHNLGLGHGDLRQCSSPYADGPTSGKKSLPTGTNGCWDTEYGDYWNVMGFGVNGYGAKPLALSMSQKQMLGVTNSSILKYVNPSSGLTQNFTLYSAGAASGLRGLQVPSPTPGGTVFVEYRNGTGQDTGMPWSNGQLYTIGGINAHIGTGVKVLKGYNSGATYGGKRSVDLAAWSGGNRVLAMRQGVSMKTVGDTARVTVTSSSAKGATAKVRVQFKGFKDGGKAVRTTANAKGTLYPGMTMKASLSGKWSVSYGGVPAKTKESYQWYRAGKVIKGATKSSYKTQLADVGKNVTVRVKPSASGYVTGKGSAAAVKKVAAPPFYDVIYGQKFYKEIWWMKSSGLSTGVRKNGKAYYQSKDKVTREAMAAFLYRLNTPKGANAPKGYKIPKKSPFKDVSTKHKFYKEIAWMAKSGLSTGIKTSSGKIYAPKSGVTREAMAAFIYRMDKAKKPVTPKKSPFVDMTPRTKFYKEIAWMSKTGLSTGVRQKNGLPKYMPKSNVTREAMAAFLYRYKH